MTRFVLIGLAALLSLPFASVRAQKQPKHTRHAASPKGASSHAAPTAPRGFGTVHFATTCHADAAPKVDHAVAQLHSFEFGAAIKEFDGVLAADSSCAMAQWGIALSRWGNPMAAGQRSPAFLAKGRAAAEAGARLGAGASERERAWIQAVGQLYEDYEHTDQAARALAYEHAMRDVVARFPADTEAKIFHAIALTASASPTDKTYARQLEAGAELERLWKKMPGHPGLAHYIIHTYDAPALAGRARLAAERYADIAPSAAHALHMPSHTFTRVGNWPASVETNVKSIKVAIANRAFGEALHASDYAVYAYLQMGKYVDAKDIVSALPELEGWFDASSVMGAAPASAAVYALAAIPARWALERSAWKEAAALKPVPSAYPYTEAMTHFARALGAAHLGDTDKVRSSIDSLASIEQRLLTKGEAYWAEQVAIQRIAADGWLAFAEHRNEDAVTRLREAATREDATEKSAVTPGPLAPAREQLADLYVELGRGKAARAEFRAVLKKEPKRLHSTLGLAGNLPSQERVRPSE